MVMLAWGCVAKLFHVMRYPVKGSLRADRSKIMNCRSTPVTLWLQTTLTGSQEQLEEIEEVVPSYFDILKMYWFPVRTKASWLWTRFCRLCVTEFTRNNRRLVNSAALAEQLSLEIAQIMFLRVSVSVIDVDRVPSLDRTSAALVVRLLTASTDQSQALLKAWLTADPFMKLQTVWTKVRLNGVHLDVEELSLHMQLQPLFVQTLPKASKLTTGWRKVGIT